MMRRAEPRQTLTMMMRLLDELFEEEVRARGLDRSSLAEVGPVARTYTPAMRELRALYGQWRELEEEQA